MTFLTTGSPDAVTSAADINSATNISGTNWVGNVFTGVGEQNNYSYVGINLQVDEAGTLTFEFSQDGTNWSNYPVSHQFEITDGINEVHGAWKGTRWIRVKYTGSDGSRTYFRLRTMYSNNPVTLTAPLSQSITSDQDAFVTRAVLTGENPQGSFINQKTDGLAFSTTSLLAGSTLSSSMTAGSTDVVVADGSDFPSSGILRIDSETLTYSSKSVNTLSGLTRPDATEHDSGATVGQVFDSGILDLSGFSQVQTDVVSDKSGIMHFFFYQDSAGTDLLRDIQIPYQDNDGFKLYASPAFAPYVCYKFYCGPSTQTDFYYDTKFTTKALNGQILGVNDYISPKMVANLGRNVIVGQDAQGTFKNVDVTYDGNLSVAIKNPKSAFGDLRTTELSPSVQVTFPYNINTDIVLVTTTETGTVTHANSMAIVSSGSNANATSNLRSKDIIKYRPGLGALCRYTTLYQTSVANSTQIHGPGDSNDGFFFGYNGTQFGILSRRNSVDTWIPQSSWSEDVMDGTGITTMILDPSKLNVYAIEYQWLGAGEINFSIEDESTGEFVVVHKIKYANKYTLPSTLNPSFPITMNITKSGADTTDLVMQSASMAGFVEGKAVVTGPVDSHFDDGLHSSETALFSLRNKTTINSITNRTIAYLLNLSVSNDANKMAIFRIYLNATLSGGTWSDINGANSIMESDAGAKFTYDNINGGKLLYTVPVGINTGDTFAFPEFKYKILPGETLTVTSETATAGLMGASLNWQEDW